MYRWPFRGRRTSSEAAPRGRLEEESDTLGVRGVGARREGVTASTPAGPAASATPARGVGTRPATITDYILKLEKENEESRTKIEQLKELYRKSEEERIATLQGDAHASASRAGPPRAPSTGAVRKLTISVESATLEDEDESPSSRTSSRDASLRPDAYGSTPRSPSSPAVATAAQPGIALQETPVFAAQAVLLKREQSGEASRVKRTNSRLSRSVGKDGKESPTMMRRLSWNSRLRGHLGSGSSEYDGSPGSSPRRAPPRR